VDIIQGSSGSTFLAGDRARFARFYKLQLGVLLIFRHCEVTGKFVIKVFDDNQCRIFHHPVVVSPKK
jgi:hypothetical protein